MAIIFWAASHQTIMIRTQGSEVTPIDMERLTNRLRRIDQLKRLCLALRQLTRDVKIATDDTSAKSAEVLRERLQLLER